MLDFAILRQYGTTNERLKEVFTAVPYDDAQKASRTKEEVAKKDADIKTRQFFQNRIRLKLNEHIIPALKNFQFYAAADLAMDAAPVTKERIPLLQYAQGKISWQNYQTQLTNLVATNGVGSQFVKKDEKGMYTMSLPTFIESDFDIVRQYVKRRWAAQSNKYGGFWPFYKYEARATGPVSRLRSDVLSQRVDIMADQFGYRHHDSQCIRDMLVYSHCLDFVRSAWEVDRQDVRASLSAEFKSDQKIEIESVIEREGVCFFNPHPTRVYWDTAWPLASINSDSGCEYCGYWDVMRFSDVKNNLAYWNTDGISFGGGLWPGIITSYATYFSNYYCTVKPPVAVADPAGQNDRQNQTGIYSQDMHDASCLVTQHFEKLIPKSHGLGDYPHPVWVRFIFASDSTIIYAEILPSRPAAYLGYDEADNRMLNNSFAHEVMPLQDQLTNLINGMLHMMEAEMMKIFLINSDVITDKPTRDLLHAKLKGNDLYKTPLVIEHSSSKQDEFGYKTEAVKLIETRLSQSINTTVSAMFSLLQMADKLFAMSPAEMGQPAPREISATEVNQMAGTTSTVYSFISDGIDDFREAKKLIIYESLVAKAEGDIVAPVIGRYPKQVIERAGFTPVPDEEEDYYDPNRRRQTVKGKPRSLVHAVIFSSRDGAERSSNTQAATVLVQMLANTINIPGILQAMGKEKLYSIINEIFRLSQTSVDLNLDMKPGESDDFGPSEVEQIKGLVTELAKAVEQEQQTTGNAISQLARKLESLQKMSLTVNFADLGAQSKSAIESNIIASAQAADTPPSQAPP